MNLLLRNVQQNHILKSLGNVILKDFDLQKYSDDMINLMYSRIYDIAGITDKSISVCSENDEKIKIKSFLDYIKLYNNSKFFIQRNYFR